MNRLTVFALGVLVGAVGLYMSENYYIVRSKETVHLVPKVAAKLEIPYRDIRNYTVDDWRNNPSLALAIVAAKKQDLMVESGLSEMQQHFSQLLQSIQGG